MRVSGLKPHILKYVIFVLTNIKQRSPTGGLRPLGTQGGSAWRVVKHLADKSFLCCHPHVVVQHLVVDPGDVSLSFLSLSSLVV